MKVEIGSPDDSLDAPDWFVTRSEELSRLLTSSPKSVADGLWYELIKRGLMTPDGRVPASTRILGWTSAGQVTDTVPFDVS